MSHPKRRNDMPLLSLQQVYKQWNCHFSRWGEKLKRMRRNKEYICPVLLLEWSISVKKRPHKRKKGYWICLFFFFFLLLILKLIFAFQQTNCPVSIWSQRRGVVSLPLLEGVLWSFTFPLLCHPHQGKNVKNMHLISFICFWFFLFF